MTPSVNARICCLEKAVSSLQAEDELTSDSVTYISEDYQVLAGDLTIVADTSGGAVVATLPDATTSEGMRKTFKRVPVGGQLLTVSPMGGDTIDGNGPFEVVNDYGSVTFRAAQGIWLITASYNA